MDGGDDNNGGAEEEEQSRGAVANPAAPLDLGILSLDDEDLTLVQLSNFYMLSRLRIED